ncbi:MAG: RnfABCDGE type electron transport complex subunit D [Clostridiales bacterium]|nr:RnfABCDGE type electron transport complex subunit D [Clostridiales bacterium]
MARKNLAPFVRSTDSVRHRMLDAILALCALFVIPIANTGPRLAVTAAFAVGICLLGEILFSLIARTPIAVTDLSCVVTGMTVTLLLPINVPQWLPATAALFATVVAKAPFGGTGRTPFHPAAAGVVFVTVCFPGQWMQTLPLARFPAWGDCVGEPVKTGARLLLEGLRPAADVNALVWRISPGAAGQTALLVLLAAGGYLLLRKTAGWEAPLCCLLTAGLAAFLFPRMVGARWESVVFELLSGTLLFCALFLAGEPCVSPRTRLGRCFFGAGVGVLTMALRRVGAYEEGALFALLLCNALAPWLDREAWTLCSKARELRRLPLLKHRKSGARGPSEPTENSNHEEGGALCESNASTPQI